jgi:hypothetical protein
MAQEDLEQAAADYERLADRLDVAARHLRRTAAHFRAAAVPRACAHVVAAEGELVAVRRGLDARAEAHAGRSKARPVESCIAAAAARSRPGSAPAEVVHPISLITDSYWSRYRNPFRGKQFTP